MQKLSKDFFTPDTEEVAKNLLGKLIKVGNKYGIITETEAYKHNCDEASHAFGKKTPRNTLMYDTYGFVYVYLIYGMHYCLNFTSDKSKPGAVLIRSIWVGGQKSFKRSEEEGGGQKIGSDDSQKIREKENFGELGNIRMSDNSGKKVGKLGGLGWVKKAKLNLGLNLFDVEKTIYEPKNRISGPGRTTKYLGIDKSFNGLDLENTNIIEVFDIGLKIRNIKATPRIGISKAKDKLWRFVVTRDYRRFTRRLSDDKITNLKITK